MQLSDWTGRSNVLALAGHAIGYLTDEYDLSLSLTDQALALNPNSATALQFGGWARLYAGDPETAMVYFLRGTRLNPIDTKRFILDSALAYACVMLGRADEAVGWAKKSLGTAPQWILAAIPLAGGLALLGREDAQASPHFLSYSLRHKRIEQPQGNSGRNRGGGVIGRSLRSCGGDSPHLDVRRVCLPTSIRGLLWSSGSASRTRQFTTF